MFKEILEGYQNNKLLSILARIAVALEKLADIEHIEATDKEIDKAMYTVKIEYVSPEEETKEELVIKAGKEIDDKLDKLFLEDKDLYEEDAST